ncbi:family 16 glycosylhydrolase [Dysgonomonas sp. 520]|uniref:family 16 glycosylhydrolase n=1 Tax=Dysgonomonas sp. 520 TaxID=2302931 RepID=UPI0013D87B24|nr:family 16 glycosylhydrolase [Dysgonomonas sp. 520]NDW10183.1 T9SS C-terminal target domain-containing protein [Dysgonomonas sp. 520]
MKKIFLLISIVALGVGQLSAQFENSKYNKLVWSDEFDGEGLPDPDKWGYEEGLSIRNNEYEYYTKERIENVFQKDGLLHIRCIGKDTLRNAQGEIINQKNVKGEVYHITSASIITKGKADWQYGRFEVRAKTPLGSGVWPAIWMMPTSDYILQGWPNCGEIDIMEFVGNMPSYVHFTAHSQKYNAKNSNMRSKAALCADSFFEFHVYAIEWYRDRIDWYLDGVLQFTYLNDNPIPGQVSIKEEAKAFPFLNPFYMILGFAYGGSWGAEGGVDADLLPLDYLVDYVRVYQEGEVGIDNENAPEAISVYPNPATDILNINSEKGVKDVSIIDVSGRVIDNYTNIDKTINIAHLNNGCYVVRITDGEDNTYIKKIIKN